MDGRIDWVGPATDDPSTADDTFDQDLFMEGKCIVPGLVDGHTHPVWSGDRVHEFELKIGGAVVVSIEISMSM